jgi:DNA-binding NtrC family response regulator
MTNRIKLLLVDDEFRCLNALTRRLTPRDFDVTPASSGRQALRLARLEDFDLVLLDLRMPGMSGEEVLRVLTERHPLTEVILLTELADIESAVSCARSGSCAYLLKPAETADLLRVIKEAFSRRVQRRLAISEKELHELTRISLGESPLSALRKIKELDAASPVRQPSVGQPS